MSQDNPLDRVKHGDPHTIAALLNKILNPKGLTVTVNRQQDCLEISLESDPVVPQEKAIAFIQKCFLKYEVTAILQVVVYGKKTGKDFPIWDAEFSWGNNAVNLDSDIGLGDESAKDQAIHEPQDGLHTSGDIIAGRYRILHILGQGGNGITYAAEDLENGSKVAIKALSLRNAGQWKQMELFEREAKVLAQLDHPQIPKYLNYFTVDTAEDRAFYIVQGLAEGKNLAQMVEDGWRTNEAEAKRIAEQVLSILIYLHDLNPPVVHRDVKPQNLIYQSGGKVSLVDFGAVQDVYQSTMARGSTVVGTFGYMAPEQFIGQAVPATDLYALGATLLFVLTHRSPSEIPQERLRFNFRSRMQVSDHFATWLQKILEPDLESRYESAKQALEELKKPKQSSPNKRSLSFKKSAILLVAGITATAIFNSRKWAILNAVNIYPCYLGRVEEYKGTHTSQDYEKFKDDLERKKLVELKDYLKSGGKADLLQEGNSFERQCQTDSFRQLVPTVIKYEDTEAIDLLIKHYDIKSKNLINTFLWQAIFSNNITMVELFISKGIEINFKNTLGATPLHLAIYSYMNSSSYKHNITIIELLVSKGADINARDNKGKTPLHYAIDYYISSSYKHNITIVELLVSKGADINVRDNEGKTPLHDAIKIYSYIPHSYNIAIVKLLVSKNADINAKDNQGFTPLHYDKSNVIRKFLKSQYTSEDIKSNYISLVKAVTKKDWDLANSLIDKVEDINSKNTQGEFLMNKLEEDIDAKDTQGKSLLDYAVEDKNINVAAFLFYKGASEIKLLNKSLERGDINTTDFLIKAITVYRGSTPLHQAAFKKDLNLAEMLIRQGANVNVRDRLNVTSLHHAIYQKDRNMAELLLSKGADINAKGYQDNTPLHSAVKRDDMDMVEFLISKGADVNARNELGYTPREMREYLEAKGVIARSNRMQEFLKSKGAK